MTAAALAKWCDERDHARRVVTDYDPATGYWVARATVREFGAKSARTIARARARELDRALLVLAGRISRDLRFPPPVGPSPEPRRAVVQRDRSTRERSARDVGASNLARWSALVAAKVSPRVASELVRTSTHPAPCPKCRADLRVNVEGHGPWCPACEPVPGRVAG